MNTLLSQFDPGWVLTVTVPLGIAVAAWLLRMSCGMCAVEAPDFWHAMLVTLLLGLMHIALRFWMNVTDVPPGIGSRFIVPMMASALVLAISLRTGPLAALRVTLVQGALCGVLYFSAALVGVLTNAVSPL